MQTERGEFSETRVSTWRAGVTNPLVAIRDFCAECLETRADVAGCTRVACPLWDFRMGKNPRRKKIVLTESEKERRKLLLTGGKK